MLTKQLSYNPFKFILYLLRNKKLKSLLDNNIYRGIGISSYKVQDLYKCSIREISIQEQTNAVKLIEPIENKIFTFKKIIKPIQTIIDDTFQKAFKFDYETFNRLKQIKKFISKEKW